MKAPVPLPTGNFDRTLVHACRELADAILDGGPIHNEARHVETAAMRSATADVPLQWIHQQLQESVKQAVAPRNRGAVPERGDISRLIDTIITVLATASTTDSEQRHSRQLARHQLLFALLNNENTTALARECGLAIAESYGVIAVAYPVSDHLPTAAAHATTRITAELAHRCGPAALARLSDEGGTILVPAPRDDTILDRLIDQLATAAQTTVTAATISAPPGEIAETACRAHELLDLALILGRTGMLHRLRDLAAEYQLTRPGPARDQLATVLDPLDRSPHLIDTLRLQLSGTLTRRAIARKLDVHTNTVEYRLKRIAALTGHDPLTPLGQWRLRGALIARARTAPA